MRPLVNKKEEQQEPSVSCETQNAHILVRIGFEEPLNQMQLELNAVRLAALRKYNATGKCL